MQISTFELLVQPIAPKPFSPDVSRRVIQAYFLTIANVDPVGSDDVVLSIQFTPTTDLKNNQIFTIVDTGSGNVFGDLSDDDITGKPSQNITLPAGKTALFVLQPDISKAAPNPASLDVAKLEVRGYVELFLSPLSPSPTANLLVSPQIRGTFTPNDLTAADPDFDQQAYGLPTPSGGALIALP
jgi:hypothetical protein